MIALLTRRALLAYARRPLNLVLLVVVPVVLVVVWAGTLADFSELLGGVGDRTQIEAATAGWAAAAVAGLAGFFQVSGSRAADRRLAAAGRSTAVVTARLGSSLTLALLASAGGLLALAASEGIKGPGRAITVTVLFAVIYLALGIVVGTFVRSEMNGALLVTLAWVFDVFFGPGMGAGSIGVTRLFPLHFPTLVMTSQASGHAGPIGDLGWSLSWAVGLSILAVARLVTDLRPTRPPSRTLPLRAPVKPTPTITRKILPAPGPRRNPVAPAAPAARARDNCAGGEPVTGKDRLAAGLRAGLREHRRNVVLWVVLVVVPVVFIALAIAVTPDTLGPVTLVEGSRRYPEMVSMRRAHAATMVPVTSAFLAGLTGLFVVTGSQGGDRRLVLAGYQTREVLAARLGVIGAATVLTTAVAVAVSSAWYSPNQWAGFTAANILVALTYAMIGVLLGPQVGRLGGLYLVLLLAFIDVGLGQTIMLGDGPPTWGAYLPARGPSRMLIDSAFTNQFDEWPYLLLGLAWLFALTAAASLAFDRRSGARR